MKWVGARKELKSSDSAIVYYQILSHQSWNCDSSSEGASINLDDSLGLFLVDKLPSPLILLNFG